MRQTAEFYSGEQSAEEMIEGISKVLRFHIIGQMIQGPVRVRLETDSPEARATPSPRVDTSREAGE